MKRMLIALAAALFAAAPASADVFQGRVESVSQDKLVLADLKPSGQKATFVFEYDEDARLSGLAYVADLQKGEPVVIEADRGVSGQLKAVTISRDTDMAALEEGKS